MRRLVLALTAVILALPVPGAVARPPDAERRALEWGVYIGAHHDDLIEFTVTARSHVRFWIMAGSPDNGWPDVPENRTYDVQIRRASMLAARAPAWRTRWTGLTAERLRLRIGGGRVLCLRIRQHSFGLTSAWSPPDCVVRGRDDARVRRTGPMHVERDTAYPDRRATVLGEGGTLRLRGVPRGARYGVVYTDRYDGRGWPHIRTIGSRDVYTSGGTGAHGLGWDARPAAPRRGTLVIDTEYGSTEPIGALVVIPRWVR